LIRETSPETGSKLSISTNAYDSEFWVGTYVGVASYEIEYVDNPNILYVCGIILSLLAILYSVSNNILLVDNTFLIVEEYGIVLTE